MPLKVAIIDYGMGNLFSVKRACEYVGLYPIVTSDVSVIMDSAAMILPGVGAFGDAMDNIRVKGLEAPIKKFIERGNPFMGICLGMQLLMSESEEFGRNKGLDIIKGSVVRFSNVNSEKQKFKVPQVGWNRIFKKPGHADKAPLEGISDGEFMYFVHSYYALPVNRQVILSTTDYGGMEYCSSVSYENVFACQFHPEKSGREGLKIYENFAYAIKDLTGHIYER